MVHNLESSCVLKLYRWKFRRGCTEHLRYLQIMFEKQCKSGIDKLKTSSICTGKTPSSLSSGYLTKFPSNHQVEFKKWAGKQNAIETEALLGSEQKCACDLNSQPSNSVPKVVESSISTVKSASADRIVN
ncbi:hypothetical protein PVL29_008987 [Vitis rotundifolia]|uniref:Uncharacterized protein n=1 Tax=Vitis rotundifolia TaxID=103349 RepID=A0AA38ZXS4_VITRO|nr:hypothetical protein PVL29_008987 [Vitis rotundifolia]